MHKISLKDFKCRDEKIILAECDEKMLYANVWFAKERITYHVKYADNYVIDVYSTLEDAIKGYNKC